MAAGGIFDHLGGGFHRYSTDDEWLVPHFEKMLYDNALLARSYLHAWQLSGKERYRRVCEETLDYLLRDMRHPEGAFFSSEDADSEGEEGRFFVWTEDEIDGALPPEEAAALRAGLRRHFRRQLRGPQHPPPRARAREVPRRRPCWPPPAHACSKAASRECGPVATRRSSPPGTVWPWRPSPRRRARSTPTRTWRRRSRVAPSWSTGLCAPVGASRTPGRTAARRRPASSRTTPWCADGFLALYEATFDERWYVAARGLLDAIPLHFAREGGGFYDTSSDHEALVARPRSLADTPLPSGNAAAARAFSGSPPTPAMAATCPWSTRPYPRSRGC